MARIRTIKPEMASDVKLASVSRDARYTFVLLISQADDEGLVAGSHRQLLGALYPHDDAVSTAMLLEWVEELVAIGAVRWRATEDGAPVLELVNWSKHQRVDNKGRSSLAAVLVPLAEVRGDSRRVAEVRGLDLGPRTMDLGPGSGTGARADETDESVSQIVLAGFPALFGEGWSDVRAFLKAKPAAKREPWVKEIQSLATLNNPADVVRAIADANASDDPLRSPLGLRAFVRRAAQDRRAGPADTPSEPAAVGGGDAERTVHAILALKVETPVPGGHVSRAIPKSKVAAMGRDIEAAYDRCGGANRFLGTPPDKLVWLVKEFDRHLAAVRAA